MYKKISVVFFVLLLSSCASNDEKKHRMEEGYAREQVSVQTALDLARSSYLFACVDIGKKYKPKVKHFNYCKERSVEYIRTHIQPIMNVPNQKAREALKKLN